jgi:iron complex transport system permease protein
VSTAPSAVAGDAPPLRARIGSPAAAQSRRGFASLSLMAVLSVSLVATFVIGVGRGAVPIDPGQVLAVVAHRLTGSSMGIALDEQADLVLWTIRIPRVVLSIGIGAALSVSGAALQGIFRNPLADPGLIGVSAGAAVGAVGSIVLGFTAFGIWSTPLAAFVGALTVTAVVFSSAFRSGRVEVVTLVLCGVGVNALAFAMVGLLTSVATDEELRNISFWQLGSVGGATWEIVTAVAPFLAVGLILLPRFARRLDLLALGEREAKHLGVDVVRTRLFVIILASLAAGSAVAVAGIISFVGLIVPHVIRLVNGPSHRTLLPASALGGAIVLTLADLVARTAVVPREIPLGVMTSLLGAPVFLVLLRKTRQQAGGFA